MTITKHYQLPILIIPLLILLFAACGMGPEATPMPTEEPTYAPVPTYTATIEAAAQSEPTALATATAESVVLAPTLLVTDVTPSNVTDAVTATVAVSLAVTSEEVTDIVPTNTPMAATAALTVAAAAINVRSGPDTAFPIIAGATTGERFGIVARSVDGAWWQACCFDGQEGWIYGELATVENADAVAVADAIPTPVQPTPEPVAATATSAPAEEAVAEAPAPVPDVDPSASSAGDFNPDAQYQIVHFKVLGLGENNGGIRDSGAQHHIFLTVLDANGNGVNGAVVENLVGEKGTVVTGDKGPGKAEITMYWEPFKLRVASDPGGPVTSQTSNQMGLAFPHLPDLVGKLGDVNYEYGACPTIDIKCEWPIQAIHFSYEITFQKVK